MNKIPRQYFWDMHDGSWVRTTELIVDELQRVAEAKRNSWKASWLPWVWAKFNRMHDKLYSEFRKMGTSVARTHKLLPGEVQVEPSELTVRLYPKHPYFWRKKEYYVHGQAARQHQR